MCKNGLRVPIRLIASGPNVAHAKGHRPKQRDLEVKSSLSKAPGSMKRSFGNSKNVNIRTESVVTSPKEFVIDISGENPAFGNESEKKRDATNSARALTFPEMANLRKDVINGIDSLNISKPTVIQSKSIPLILKGKSVLCAAQTGSGKTLSYLIPIFNMLKNEEDDGLMTRYQHPCACIIAPFRELAIQILQVVKQMAHQVPLRAVGCIGGEKDKIMYKALREKPVDILVGTPGTVLDLLSRNKISFSNLKYMVIDEVDTMYDASFKEMTSQLLKSVQPNTEKDGGRVMEQCKFVFAAATLPKHGVLSTIKVNVPDMEVVTANLHHILPHVKYHFIKSLQPEKPAELVRILKLKISKDKKAVIFVNNSSTCNWLSKYLNEQEISHFKLSGKNNPEERQKIFREFKSKDSGLIISTDLASRGLDFPDLCYVINYECPLNTTDFIHRAGRTGRARADYFGTPEVYTLLSRNWEVTLARKVESAAKKKKAISDINVIKRGQHMVQLIQAK